eukprot:PhF_6_TR21067/c0_g1_i1/m.30344
MARFLYFSTWCLAFAFVASQTPSPIPIATSGILLPTPTPSVSAQPSPSATPTVSSSVSPSNDPIVYNASAPAYSDFTLIRVEAVMTLSDFQSSQLEFKSVLTGLLNSTEGGTIFITPSPSGTAGNIRIEISFTPQVSPKTKNMLLSYLSANGKSLSKYNLVSVVSVVKSGSAEGSSGGASDPLEGVAVPLYVVVGLLILCVVGAIFWIRHKRKLAASQEAESENSKILCGKCKSNGVALTCSNCVWTNLCFSCHEVEHASQNHVLGCWPCDQCHHDVVSGYCETCKSGMCDSCFQKLHTAALGHTVKNLEMKILCEQCETNLTSEANGKWCLDCKRPLCEKCDNVMHKKSLASHVRCSIVSVSACDTNICANCSGASSVFCNDCAKPYCSECDLIIHKKKSMANHVKTSVEKSGPEIQANSGCGACGEALLQGAVSCVECGLFYCSTCDERIHRKKKASHTRTLIGQACGNCGETVEENLGVDCEECELFLCDACNGILHKGKKSAGHKRNARQATNHDDVSIEIK